MRAGGPTDVLLDSATLRSGRFSVLAMQVHTPCSSFGTFHLKGMNQVRDRLFVFMHWFLYHGSRSRTWVRSTFVISCANAICSDVYLGFRHTDFEIKSILFNYVSLHPYENTLLIKRYLVASSFANHRLLINRYPARSSFSSFCPQSCTVRSLR